MEDLIKLIKDVKKAFERELPKIQKEINFIINDKITSEKRIEETLDIILGYIYLGLAEEEFKRLNKYYSTINKDHSEAYTKIYEDIFK